MNIVTPTGSLVYYYLTGAAVSATPLLSAGGAILFGSQDAYFYSVCVCVWLFTCYVCKRERECEGA